MLDQGLWQESWKCASLWPENISGLVWVTVMISTWPEHVLCAEPCSKHFPPTNSQPSKK